MSINSLQFIHIKTSLRLKNFDYLSTFQRCLLCFRCNSHGSFSWAVFVWDYIGLECQSKLKTSDYGKAKLSLVKQLFGFRDQNLTFHSGLVWNSFVQRENWQCFQALEGHGVVQMSVYKSLLLPIWWFGALMRHQLHSYHTRDLVLFPDEKHQKHAACILTKGMCTIL